MTAILMKLSWCVHRALCYGGVHAAERVYRYDAAANDPVLDGWFCSVCRKSGEKKKDEL